jgi:hypothetical protein
MKKLMLATFIILIFSFKGYANFRPPVINIEKIYDIIKTYKDTTVTRNFKEEFLKNIVFINDSTAYFNPNGTLHLFKINFDSLIHVKKLSNSIYHGGNFGRYLFTNKGNIYSLGGSGLWSSIPKLLEFNFKNKEWFSKKIKNFPENTKLIASSWVIGDKLKTLIILNTDNNYSKKLNFMFGEIDLNDFSFAEIGEFESVKSADLIVGNKNIIYESNRYLILQVGNSTGYRYDIFDKKKGEILKMNLLEGIPFINGKSFAYINDSILFYRNKNLVTDSVVLNNNSIFFKSSIEDIYIENINQSRINKISSYSIGFIILALLIILLIKKINLSSNSFHENTLEIEKKLLINKGSVIKRDELDELLGISHLSFDSIKSKRSSIIRTININGRLKIERIRKEDDKRFFKYSIN